MITKLTKEDFEGYKSRVIIAQKINLIEHEQNTLILDWLTKRIAKCPEPTTKKAQIKKEG